MHEKYRFRYLCDFCYSILTKPETLNPPSCTLVSNLLVFPESLSTTPMLTSCLFNKIVFKAKNSIHARRFRTESRASDEPAQPRAPRRGQARHDTAQPRWRTECDPPTHSQPSRSVATGSRPGCARPHARKPSWPRPSKRGESRQRRSARCRQAPTKAPAVVSRPCAPRCC